VSRDTLSTTYCNTLQHTATHTHCNTLQHTIILQHTAHFLYKSCVARHTADNILQHTATHCNTLQHSATHSTFPVQILCNVTHCREEPYIFCDVGLLSLCYTFCVAAFCVAVFCVAVCCVAVLTHHRKEPYIFYDALLLSLCYTFCVAAFCVTVFCVVYMFCVAVLHTIEKSRTFSEYMTTYEYTLRTYILIFIGNLEIAVTYSHVRMYCAILHTHECMTRDDCILRAHEFVTRNHWILSQWVLSHRKSRTLHIKSRLLQRGGVYYGLATDSRIDKIIGLFCRISSLFYRALLQTRPIIVSILLAKATPYLPENPRVFGHFVVGPNSKMWWLNTARTEDCTLKSAGLAMNEY